MRKKQLLRVSSDQEMYNPQQQLREISVEEDQNQLKFYSSRSQMKNKYSHIQQNIRLPKGFNEDIADISQWNSQKKLQTKQKIQQKKNIKYQKGQKLSYKFRQFQHKISKSQDQKDRFLSMAELCHRYTFVNQHGSHSQYFTRKSFLNRSHQIEKQQFLPKNIELKLQMPQDYILQKYQTNISFFNQTHSNQIILPVIKKNQQTDTPKNFASENMNQESINNVLKLMGKFGRNKRIMSPTNKNSIQKKSSINYEQVNKKKQSGLREKIYWKNKMTGNSQFSHLEEHLCHQKERQIKGIVLYVGSSLQKVLGEKKERKKQEILGLVYKGRKNKIKINNKPSQRMQQCLILNRSVQKK